MPCCGDGTCIAGTAHVLQEQHMSCRNSLWLPTRKYSDGIIYKYSCLVFGLTRCLFQFINITFIRDELLLLLYAHIPILYLISLQSAVSSQNAQVLMEETRIARFS